MGSMDIYSSSYNRFRSGPLFATAGLSGGRVLHPLPQAIELQVRPRRPTGRGLAILAAAIRGEARRGDSS